MKKEIKDAFNTVHASDALKQETLSFITSKSKNHSSPRTSIRLALTCALFLFVGTLGYRIFLLPVSAISLEVNPAFEFQVNSLGQVISFQAENEEAQAIIESVSVQFSKYSDAIDTILTSDEMKPYLNDDNSVFLTVIGENENVENEMLTCLNKQYDQQEGVHCSAGNQETAQEAQELDLPYAKYTLYKELTENGISISVDDARSMTMRELRLALDPTNANQGNGLNNGSGQNGGNGNQNGNGPKQSN